MKPQLVLLYTHDRSFDRVSSDALQVVSGRGGELDFATLDFNDGYRGMTLRSAIHPTYAQSVAPNESPEFQNEREL
jgi:hypothetical protein